MRKAGDETARIAAKLKITVEEVEDRIRGFESARAALSQDMIGMVMNAEVMEAMRGAGGRLNRVIHHAKRFTGAYDPEGNPIYEPDDQMSVEAVKVAGELAERAMPKSGGINIGINNNPGGGSSGGNGQVKTFEQRVREKRGVLPEGDVKFLADGKGNEVVDGEIMDDEDDDEIIDDMADGTSEAEIEEADEVRD